MAFSPAEIDKALKAVAARSKRGLSTKAFTLAWTAWDPYNYRVVLSAIQMQ
jgi:hypothetical protein